MKWSAFESSLIQELGYINTCPGYQQWREEQPDGRTVTLDEHVSESHATICEIAGGQKAVDISKTLTTVDGMKYHNTV